MTVVEWLVEQMINKMDIRIENTTIGLDLLEQAKEMEKEQTQSLKDDAELNHKIIVKQEEFLQRLEHAVGVRDKYIVLLESQLKIQDSYITKK